MRDGSKYPGQQKKKQKKKKTKTKKLIRRMSEICLGDFPWACWRCWRRWSFLLKALLPVQRGHLGQESDWSPSWKVWMCLFRLAALVNVVPQAQACLAPILPAT